LQAALIVDVLRAHQLVMEQPKYKDLVDKIIFMGHSLGGACSVIAAAKVQVGTTLCCADARRFQIK